MWLLICAGLKLIHVSESLWNSPVLLRTAACSSGYVSAGLILGLHPANERRRYKVTPSLIGWAQT